MTLQEGAKEGGSSRVDPTHLEIRLDVDSRPREYVSCNLCGFDSSTLWGQKHGLNIVRCENCRLIYANPRLDKVQLSKYYNEKYFADADYEGDIQRGEMYKIEISQMIDIVGSQGKFLDVGCAYGSFLRSLPDTFDKYGVEFSEAAASYAKAKTGYEIRGGELQDMPFQDGFFDVVQFRGVFEHLRDPQVNLETASRLLRDGGWLILSTIPNIAGPCGRLFKERFRLVYPREHIYYFSKDTLRQYCHKNKLSIEYVFYPYLGTPYENVSKDIIDLWVNYWTGGESPPFFRSVITVFARKSPR